MNQRIDLTGQVFGRLTVVGYAGRQRWRCICECGNEHIAASIALRKGAVRSCTCLRRELQSARKKKHGMTGTPTYESWCKMRSRCYNQDSDQYQWYGAKGVTVCARWRESFKNFLEDMGLRPEGTYLDRKNPEGNYTQDNCEWRPLAGTLHRNSVLFEGKTMTQISQETGIKYHTLTWRMRKYGTPFPGHLK